MTHEKHGKLKGTERRRQLPKSSTSKADSGIKEP